MLKMINPLISPELLCELSKMGHGDEIVLSDAHFPADSVNDTIFRADGIEVADLLDAILPLFELDQYVDDKVVMMQAVSGDHLPEGLVEEYSRSLPGGVAISFTERFAFYERSKNATCVVVTGTTRKYGNIILKKGVTPDWQSN
ncbi:L-fucose mutarotase [Alginatibacterium sediminis]|uniref:L-fucose mutarotase n=1 Tax=Alginatibacterium sediminis TaxID=2164068 RepID=A0A420EH72_9ALTE|nr:L-fucose mutarotase [Alginatibacterium sediminis]RKF20081.1 L-fucose mutarotase [Alginatibacterium sediminis]